MRRTAALFFASLALVPAATAAGDFPLAETALAGSDLLAYLISCALPSSEAAAETGTGARRLRGGLGLAPDWRRRGLTPAEAGRVSACILARLNRSGAHVEVSLRAGAGFPDPPPALDASPAEHRAFPLHEGGFSGDLFGPGAPAYVCQGRAAVETPDLLRKARRLCALPSGATSADGAPLSECGLIITGPCDGGETRRDEIHVFLREP